MVCLLVVCKELATELINAAHCMILIQIRILSSRLFSMYGMFSQYLMSVFAVVDLICIIHGICILPDMANEL